ncbi:MAG: prepilin peptidase [Bacillota bacterium]|nr:prepilin peptidase [Bacillota bacterium]
MVLIYTVAVLLGGFVGFLLEKITVNLINKRVKEPINHRFSGSVKKTILWMLISASGWVIAVAIGGLSAQTVEFALLFSACLVLSAVDISIRKIPNEIIVFILIIGFAFTVINNNFNIIQNRIIGLIAGFVIFYLPSLIGMGAGLGDVKFAAAVGFCLGVYNFLTAVFVMTIVLLIYTIYLYVTGKGNLKTKVALGFFLAAGFVVVMLINILNMKQMVFDMEMFLNSI